MISRVICSKSLCAVGIVLLLVGTLVPSPLGDSRGSPVSGDDSDSISTNGVDERSPSTDDHVQETDSTTIPPRDYYIEQPPPPSSEWDGIYERYTLVSQQADITYDRASQDGLSNLAKMLLKYRLKDRQWDTYYETGTAFDISQHPCYFWFEFPTPTSVSLMRLYYYHPDGLEYAPAVYTISSGSTDIATYHIAPQDNGQWVRIDFPYEITSTTNITLKILHTRGSVDHSENPTKVAFNEVEFFENRIPPAYPQHTLPYYEDVTKFWNGFDWAISVRIDDCHSSASFPAWWTDILPISAMCYDLSHSMDTTYVDTKHMEVGSHGNIQDHTANYNKNYNWWRPRAEAAKESIERYTSKTSLWGEQCISFAIPLSVMEPQGGQAFLDAGFKRVAWIPGPAWHWRVLGGQNLSLYNVAEPKSQVPMDWMFTYGAGYAKTPWTEETTLKFKENKSYANLLIHPPDTLDPAFKSFIENDDSGWHCTLGEIASYFWYKDRINVTFNQASNDTEKIFDIHIYEQHQNVWEVPITFAFLLADFDWKGTIIVKWTQSGEVYTSSLPNISGLSPGVGQHRNQTMREGYRWDATHRILYVSVKPGSRDHPKTIYLTTGHYNQPYTPIINGPTSGKRGTTHSFTFLTTDPHGEDVSYIIDWGDGKMSGWLGPYPSGLLADATHKWKKKGTYEITIKAKNTDGIESDPAIHIVKITGMFNGEILSRILEKYPNAFPLLRRFFEKISS